MVNGTDDVSVRFSRCCSPIPGDEIVGFITRGRGISIHRTDCVNIINMDEVDRSRLTPAEWQHQDSGSDTVQSYSVAINVYAHNRTGLMADISQFFKEKKIDMSSVNSRINKPGTKATVFVSFDVKSMEELSHLIEKIRQIDGVIDIERTRG